MLKASRSNINNKNAKEKKDENDLKNKYINLSLKTKLLIKNELNKASDDELSNTLNSLDDFIDIVNNFNDPGCSCRNELSYLLWKRSEIKCIKSNFQFLHQENFIEKITQFFDEDYYYDIDSKVLQNILKLFIELITPTYYEEDHINENVTKWTFGIHELFSDYDPIPLYPEENNIIKLRLENLYRHPSNIFEKFLSRLFFIFIIDESDKNTAINSANELNECKLVAKFLLLAWKFGSKTIKSNIKKLTYNDIPLSDLLSVAIWRLITEYDIYNSKLVSRTLWMVIYLFENINEGNSYQHFSYVTLVQLFINKDNMPLLDNLMEEEVNIDFKTITEKIFYFSLKNLKSITINKEMTSKILKKMDEREDINNLSLAILKFFSLQLANIKKINDHSPLKLVHKEFLWILINAKSMNINLSKSLNQNVFFKEANNYYSNVSSSFQIYSTISFNQKPVLYNLEVLLCTYYIEKSSITELISIFLDEVKNIKAELLKKDDKKMLLYNENKLKKMASLKSKYDSKKSNVKAIQESSDIKNNNTNDNNNNDQKSEISKQKSSRHHRSASYIEKSLSSIEESRVNFMKLCELVIKLQKKKNVDKEKIQKDMMRYNPLHKHIWNIYCVNDIFFRIIKKFLIFQSDENCVELMNIVSSMNESSKKINISSIITQLCTNFINMLIDIKNMNIYSNEYVYLITMMLSNVEKSLKKFFGKPTYWINFIDDIIKVLLPFHILEFFNRPIEHQNQDTTILGNDDSNDSSNNNLSNEESESHKLKDDISNTNLINTSWFKPNETINNKNDTKTSIPSIPSIPNENSSNKLTLPSLMPSSSSTFLPPISSSSSSTSASASTPAPAPVRLPDAPEKKLKRCDSLEPLEPISNNNTTISQDFNFKSLSRSSSSSSLNSTDGFCHILSQRKTSKSEIIGIENEIKLYLIKSLLRNIEETISNCDFIPLNLCSIPLPSIKNHKRSVSVIQKKNTLINLPSVKTPLPPTSKKPKNQVIRKKNTISSNATTTKNNCKSTNPCQKNDNKTENEIEINIDDTTDSEIYDDFDSESSSSLDSKNRGSCSSSEDEDGINGEIKSHKKSNNNIYEQETIYFIQFKLKEYIKSLKDYTVELNNVQANCKNYLALSLQNILEKHILLLQSYYKKTVAAANSEASKAHYSRQRQHTSIEPSSLNHRVYPPKIESIKNPIIFSKAPPPPFKPNNSLRDPLLVQNRIKVYSSLPPTKTLLHVNVTNIVLEPIRRNCTKIPSIKHTPKPFNPINT